MSSTQKYLQKQSDTEKQYYGITLGTVIDVNDPLQQGRVRVLCQFFGETFDMDTEDIPFARNGSSVLGTTYSGTRGPDNFTTDGGVSYGFFSIPKVGSIVLIACIDGNIYDRIWLGSISAQYVAPTLPHGRFTYKNSDQPDGPLSTEDTPIEPLNSFQVQAFGGRVNNFEWRTRGADYTIGNTFDEELERYLTNLADDKNITVTNPDGTTFVHTQGYATDRHSNIVSELTKNASAPSVNSWTSPGNHSISMDDRIENCRMRIRTTTGRQILLDDTNERIYINTPNGSLWIQLDDDGHLDIYTNQKCSIRSESDINLHSERTVRIYGKEGVHIRSDNEIRMFSKNNFHLCSDKEALFSSSKNFNITAGNEIQATGSKIHLNGPKAKLPEATFFTNRTPSHEPWGRTDTKDDFTHEPNFDYNDPQIGREFINRGKFWRR